MQSPGFFHTASQLQILLQTADSSSRVHYFAQGLARDIEALFTVVQSRASLAKWGMISHLNLL
jgi:hypothetical protein